MSVWKNKDEIRCTLYADKRISIGDQLLLVYGGTVGRTKGVSSLTPHYTDVIKSEQVLCARESLNEAVTKASEKIYKGRLANDDDCFMIPKIPWNDIFYQVARFREKIQNVT